jgi:uncharacterized membrane protein YdjX (TVP38/TMEM64 family)
MSDDRSQAAREGDASRTRGAVLRYAPFALIVAGLVLSYSLGLQDYLSLAFLAEKRDELRSFVDERYAVSALAFLFAYIFAVAFSFPAASILTVFGGFLFGWLVGGALVAVGATTGATLLFLAARSALGGFLRHRVNGVVKRVADGFRDAAFGYLLIIRLAPVFPFFAVNIAAALLDITLAQFVGATFLGILPGTFAYAYLGQGIDSVLVAASDSGRTASVSDLVTGEITLAFLFLAIVAAIPTIVSQVRRSRTRR